MCVAGKYKQDLGSAGCAACPTDHFAPAQSTMASACYQAPKVVFVLAMGGDIYVSDMTEKVQAQMLDNIAKSLQMDSSLLKIVSITNARRRLLALNVNVQAIVQDDAAASAAAGLAQAVAAAATSGASDAGFNVTITSSAIIVPAPLPIVSTPPAPSPSSPDVLWLPPKGPFPVTTNVPVAVNSPPSEKSDEWTSKKGASKTGIIAACIASAALFFIVTSFLLYRRHAKKRKQSAKSAGIGPSFLAQQPVTMSEANLSQPLLSTDAGQDPTLEDSAAGVQALYPQDQPPVNCRINERPLAQACADSSPVSEEQSAKLVAFKSPVPQEIYLSPLFRENNSAYAECNHAGVFTTSAETEAETKHTEVLPWTIAGMDDEVPARSNPDKETILPAPAAPILSDSAPASSGSRENLVDNEFQKAIVHTSQEIGDLMDVLPASNETVFQAVLEFAEPATVENRCQDSLRFSALDASLVLLRMLPEFCAASRFLLPCVRGFDGR